MSFQGLHETTGREFSPELNPGKGGSCPTRDSGNGNSPKGKGMNFNGTLKDFKFSCSRQLFRAAEKRL